MCGRRKDFFWIGGHTITRRRPSCEFFSCCLVFSPPPSPTTPAGHPENVRPTGTCLLDALAAPCVTTERSSEHFVAHCLLHLSEPTHALYVFIAIDPHSFNGHIMSALQHSTDNTPHQEKLNGLARGCAALRSTPYPLQCAAQHGQTNRAWSQDEMHDKGEPADVCACTNAEEQGLS